MLLDIMTFYGVQFILKIKRREQARSGTLRVWASLMQGGPNLTAPEAKPAADAEIFKGGVVFELFGLKI